MNELEEAQAKPKKEKKEKVHFHLYLDKEIADWLRRQREENYMPHSASVALAVRDYRKRQDQDE